MGLEGLPEGYEAVRWGVPKEGEEFMDGIGRPFTLNHNPKRYRLIVRRKWEWPEWIKSGTWIAMDKSGKWWLYSREPFRREDRWDVNGYGSMIHLTSVLINFDPPPCDDWRASKMQKPHDEACSCGAQGSACETNKGICTRCGRTAS